MDPLNEKEVSDLDDMLAKVVAAVLAARPIVLTPPARPTSAPTPAAYTALLH